MKPIGEDEALSWDELLELTDGPKPCEQPLLLFGEAEPKTEELEQQEDARAPPEAFFVGPETYTSFSASGA